MFLAIIFSACSLWCIIPYSECSIVETCVQYRVLVNAEFAGFVFILVKFTLITKMNMEHLGDYFSACCCHRE